MLITEFTETQHRTLSWEFNPAHHFMHYDFMFEIHVEGTCFEETDSVRTEHSEQNNTGLRQIWGFHGGD